MNIFETYLRERSGHFAMLFALLAIPILTCVAIALETSNNIRKTKNLQNALDSAAIAAVIPGNLDPEDREAMAEQVFYENFKIQEGVWVEATASQQRVDIAARVSQERFFIDFLGSETSHVSKKATAVRTEEDVVCVMTLSQNSVGSLKFEKNTEFNAPGCSIQVNSNSRQALAITGNYQPDASSICVVGGAIGNLPPDLKTDCAPIADPYASKSHPPNSPCDYGLQAGFLGASEAYIIGQPNKQLNPGVYCGGLHIYDSTVELAPGTYVIQNGPLTIGHNSRVTGDGVTFVLSGTGSVLYTYEDIEMNLKASRLGDYAGLIFFQDPSSTPGEVSILKGGINMHLVGTVYFPTQDLFVGGIGEMGANSPALAFTANNITFTSDIEIIISQNEANILEMKRYMESGLMMARSYNLTTYEASALSPVSAANDHFITTIQTSRNSHETAGLPPILPRSDAGARLILSD